MTSTSGPAETPSRGLLSGARRGWIVAAIALAAAGAIAGYAWYRTLTAEPATGPQVMTWHKADGSPPTDPPGDTYPFRGCRGDMQLDLAVWRNGVIATCEDEAVGAGWAWLDPVAKRAELRWPVPPGPEITRTRGLIPGPNGELAIVFERDLNGPLFVGIAAPHGWSRPPESLGRVLYRAAAWVGLKLEVVVTPTTEGDRWGLQQAHAIVTFAAGPRTERRTAPCIGRDCMTPTIAYRAGGRWVFEGWGRAVTETGEPAPGVVPKERDDGGVDLLAHGRLDIPTAFALGETVAVIDADGKATTSPPPPWSELSAMRQSFYVIDHRTRRQPLWAADRSYQKQVEQVEGRTLVSYIDADDDRVRIADDLSAVASARPVARWGQRMARRITYPDLAGGYWIVDADGQHIHLDAALRRTDPLPLRDHLRRRGSVLREIDEPEHERYLGWALFGLPVLLVACYLLAGVIRGPGDRARWRLRAAPIAVAAGGYALIALIALSKVLPLLG